MPSLRARFSEWYSRQPAVVKALTIIGAGSAACICGVFVAPAVGAIASAAGLGVAGGTLSGAAASSAGLAALGGGSVASGGLGMAGGTAVVSAIAGGLGVGGTTVASRQVHKAGSRSSQYAKAAAEQSVKHGEIHFDEEG